MKGKWKSLIGLVLSTSLVITGCSVSSSGDKEASLAENQVLRLSIPASIPTLDSGIAIDTASMDVLNNIQEGLMRSGKTNQPENGIAEDVEISEDKMTYTFKLREDAKWSDGKSVTAKDFEYAWKRVLDPKTASQYAHLFYPIKNAQEYHIGQDENGKPTKATVNQVGIKAKDDQTLTVTLKRPMFNFLSVITLPTFLPIREDIHKKFGDQYALQPENMLYNGPFVLKSQSQSKWVLTKNEQYWDKNSVYLNTVELYTVKDVALGINLYNAGQVDTAMLDQAFVDAFKQSPDYVKVDHASTFYVQMNHSKSFTNNANIRKAISLAIDRQDITQGILKDGSAPALSMVPPSLNGAGNKSFRSHGEVISPNTELAQQYFKTGLKELGLTKAPDRVVLVCTDTTTSKNVALTIKDQLQKILGLDVKLDSPPLKVRLEKATKGEFDLMLSGWGADYNDPMSFLDIWTSDNSMNHTRYKNPQYDQLIQQAKMAKTQEEQFKYLLQAEQKLVGVQNGDTTIAPLYYMSESILQKTKVKEVYRHPYGATLSLKWAYIAKQQDK
ncbi:peptide ABC transporter substrate-binding protein [Hazenella coriacea]|uniref:Oligopeptide transport system substrate-binding protein n=1 Tax=Hazenella coriacea TaxID=1179467 RepID=A0A4R3LB20_9BACL|nr:peptide ABC transporter substrate-binding protein [Hazenella coriacea]TCS96912.1 oligopeptide transport system substrate-binding protein [Hazenella coriacea]